MSSMLCICVAVIDVRLAGKSSGKIAREDHHEYFMTEERTLNYAKIAKSCV